MNPYYREPITQVGVRLARGELFSFRLHEAGCRRFSVEWNYPDVRSPFWRLYWNDRPGAWIAGPGWRLDLEPSSFVLIPSHVLFDTHGAPRPITHFWVHFSLYPDLIARNNVPIRVPCRKELARQVAALARKVARPDATRPAELHHRCHALLHLIFADPAAGAHSRRLPAGLYDLLDEIEASLAKPTPIPVLARQAGMSRGGFIRWFKQHMEVSPARYVLGRRINHACRLLKFSSATIEDISSKLGFANRSHFSRAFQRQMGSGPASFRRN